MIEPTMEEGLALFEFDCNEDGSLRINEDGSLRIKKVWGCDDLSVGLFNLKEGEKQ